MATKNIDSTILAQAMKIWELAYTLHNVTTDDNIPLESVSEKYILTEAKYVLSLFHEGGTSQNDMLRSDDRDERADARKQIRQLRSLIARIEKAKA